MTPEPEKATGFEYDRETLTYELVWSDEFDTDGAPDPEKWGYDRGGNGWGNHELQYYSSENVTVADGKLIIELRQEAEEGPQQYTSARLVSRNKGDWTYGKIEVRAKLPAGRGTWPAIWMMPTRSVYGSWPLSGEIDIMEHVGFDPEVIHATVHNGAYHGGDGKGDSRPVEGVCEDFHTYAVEWLPDRLCFSVDGEALFEYDPHAYAPRPPAQEWPYDQDFYLLLNVAFGGDWGGAQGVDPACLPARMEVEYVRVYQSPEIRALTGQGTDAPAQE